MAYTDTLKVPEKKYAFKVTNQAGVYLREWPDVIDPGISYSQNINTPGTTIQVRLARNPNKTTESRDDLTDSTSDPLTTQDGITLSVSFNSPNLVGENTDVDVNNNVDVYVYYGGYENLIADDGDQLTDQTGDPLLLAVGAPSGQRIFSGYIMDYELTYSDVENDGVSVTLASNGAELSQKLIKSGAFTTSTYALQDHSSAVKTILDTDPGIMTYSSLSVDSTNNQITPTFRLNTKLEGIEQIYELAPAGWWWYGNIGENTIYFKPKPITVDHTFTLGMHIKSMNLKRTIESLKNDAYIIGGGTPPLYYRRTVTSSINRGGIERKTDRRYVLGQTIDSYANKVFNRYSEPIYTTEVTIPSAVYEIELIKLGQLIGFSNFGTIVDQLTLQVVGISYTPTQITMQLGELQERQFDSIVGLEESLQSDQYEDIPTMPS